MRYLILIVSAFIFLSFTAKKNSNSSILYLNVEGIEKIEGNLGILVFNSADGFPKNPEKAVLELEVKVTAKTMKIELSNLPYGEYAFSLLHDLNSNKEMDENMLGIPKEPYGFSNNPGALSGVPDFEDCMVSLSKENSQTTIELVSW